MLKIIDFHVHPLPVITPEELLYEMDTSFVDKAVLLSMELEPELLKNTKVRHDISKHFDYTNFVMDIENIYSGMDYVLKIGHTPMEHVVKLVESNRNRFIGFGSVHIGYNSKKFIKAKLKTIKQYKENYDFKGIKILPTLQFFNPSESGLELVFKFAQENDLIVTYHTGCDPGPWEIPLLSKHANPSLIESLVRRYDTKVVLAHMGSYSSHLPGIWFDEATSLMKNYPNVYGDISAVPYLMTQEKSIEFLRQNNIFSKVLYGSDYPVTSAGAKSGMSVVFSYVYESPLLQEEEKRLIFYENASKLLDLE